MLQEILLKIITSCHNWDFGEKKTKGVALFAEAIWLVDNTCSQRMEQKKR